MKTLKIYGRAIETKEGDKFVQYSYTKDGKTFYQVKFTKDCDFLPNKEGYWAIDVEFGDISIQKSKPNEEGKKLNDTIWVKKFTNFKEDTESKELAAQKRLQELEDLLG